MPSFTCRERRREKRCKNNGFLAAACYLRVFDVYFDARHLEGSSPVLSVWVFGHRSVELLFLLQPLEHVEVGAVGKVVAAVEVDSRAQDHVGRDLHLTDQRSGNRVH